MDKKDKSEFCKCEVCGKKKQDSRTHWCEKIDNFICDTCCTGECEGCSNNKETKKAPSK